MTDILTDETFKKVIENLQFYLKKYKEFNGDKKKVENFLTKSPRNISKNLLKHIRGNLEVIEHYVNSKKLLENNLKELNIKYKTYTFDKLMRICENTKKQDDIFKYTYILENDVDCIKCILLLKSGKMLDLIKSCNVEDFVRNTCINNVEDIFKILMSFFSYNDGNTLILNIDMEKSLLNKYLHFEENKDEILECSVCLENFVGVSSNCVKCSFSSCKSCKEKLDECPVCKEKIYHLDNKEKKKN